MKDLAGPNESVTPVCMQARKKSQVNKILLINEGYSSNLGDQAIKDSLTEALGLLGKEVDFAYYSNPRVTKLPDYDYLKTDSSHSGKQANGNSKWAALKQFIGHLNWYFRNYRPIRRIVKKEDYACVIIGGGQLLNSSDKLFFNTFSLALSCWVNQIRRHTKKPIYLIGVGTASRFHRAEHFFYKRALRKIDRIWVRDTQSKQSLANIFNVDAELIPDVAFFDTSSYKKSYQKTDLGLVGIYSYYEFDLKFNKNGIDQNGYYELWYDEVRRYMKEGYQVKLFYTTKADAAESILFKQYLEDRYQLFVDIVPTSTLPDLCRLFAQARKIYSGRMHALILGMKYGCIPEPYLINDKLVSFNNEYVKSKMDPACYSKQVLSILEKNFAV